MIGLFFLTYKPNKDLINFIPKLKSDIHDVYLIIDDNRHKYPKIDNVEIVQLDDKICIDSSYYKSWYDGPRPANLTLEKSKCTAIDKAFYYFSKKKKNYDYVWLIEDDVLLTSDESINLLDKKYLGYDLITSKNDVNKLGDTDWWGWKLAKKNFKLPWACSMMNIFRLSKKYINLLKNYVNKKHHLEYPETFYNTFAIHNNLKIATPKELSTCVWRKAWNVKDYKLNYFYHPVKDYLKHTEFRNNLAIQNGGRSKKKKYIYKKIKRSKRKSKT